MQTRFTVDTSQPTKDGEMQLQLTQADSQTLTCSLGDFLANLLAFVDTSKDSKMQGVECFLKSQGFSKTANPNIFYSRMLRVYCLTMGESLSKQYLGSLINWGMMLNGVFIIPNFMVFHKREREIVH